MYTDTNLWGNASRNYFDVSVVQSTDEEDKLIIHKTLHIFSVTGNEG